MGHEVIEGSDDLCEGREVVVEEGDLEGRKGLIGEIG